MSGMRSEITGVAGFFDRWQDAWDARDPERIAAMFAEDGVWQEPITPDPAIGRGSIAQELRAVFTALPDLELEILQVYAGTDKSRLADRFRITGTSIGALEPPGYAPTNQPVTFEGAGFFELDGGQITRATVVMDMLDVGRQIGAAPAPGTRAERVGILLQRASARKMRRRASVDPSTVTAAH